VSYDAPYAGLRVVDLSQGIAGPYCAMLLAQYGADVVKIEPPDGDWARRLGVQYGDHTAFSVAGNLGKRSVVLDLKQSDDKATLSRLIERADVFLEGFRPGVINRLGFGYDTVSAANPRILYLSISGFGQVGELAEKPAMDPILQAFSGFMKANLDREGRPVRTTPIIIDMTTALYGFQAVSAALFARQTETVGRRIDLNLMQGAANLQCVRMMQTHLLGEQPPPNSAPNGAFHCKQGMIFVVVMRQDHYAKLCDIIGLPELATDPRLQTPLDRSQHRAEINERVAAAMLKKTAAEWTELFTEAGLQNEQVLDYLEFLEHPQVAATGLISWLDQPGMDRPVPMPNPPGTPPLKPQGRLAHSPTIGEHTAEVLAEIA